MPITDGDPARDLIGRPYQCPECCAWLVPGHQDHDCKPRAFRHPVFLSWREALAQSQRQIQAAYEQRAGLCRSAAGAGLTYKQIGEGLGLSAAAVHKIIARERAGLDDPVSPSAPQSSRKEV